MSRKQWAVLGILAAGLLVFGQNCSLNRSEIADGPSFDSLRQLSKFDEEALKNIQPRDGLFRLMAIVDHQCLSEKSLEPNQLSRRISDPQKDKSEIKIFAYGLLLQTKAEIFSLKDEALADPCLVHLTEDKEVQKMLYPNPPNDPLWSEQKNLAAIEASAAWNVFFPSSGATVGIDPNLEVLVGVIDTGIRRDHVDLKNNLWSNKMELNGTANFDDDGNGYVDDVEGWDCSFNDKNPEDNDGHGTHVAGIIGAQVNNSNGIAGVMGRSIKILPFKILDPSATGSSTCLFNGINYMVQKQVKAINLSLGSTQYLESVKQALKNAINNGVFVAAAAGNDGKIVGQEVSQYPAAYAFDIAGLMSIGSVDALTNLKSNFSNHGPMYVDIAAPGSDTWANGVLSSFKDGPDSYTRKRGTSMSTPHIVGAAALAIGFIRSRGYAWPTPAQVEDILQTSAPSSTELTGFFKNGKYLNLNSLAVFLNTGYPDLPSSPVKNCLGMNNFDCEMFNAINAERVKANASSLSISSKCNSASESHVTEMIQNGFFGPSGVKESAEQRFTRFGLAGSAAGLLIAYNYQTTEEVLSQYLNSTRGHKELLLDERYWYVGIFSAKDIDGRPFVSICFSENN